MVRRIAVADFPSGWQADTPGERSQDSTTYGKRFMLRLGEPTWEKLDALSTSFGTSAAAIIRQLIAQATPDDFPPSWQLRTAEHRARPPRPADSRREETCDG
jgi:hypothetical protein